MASPAEFNYTPLIAQAFNELEAKKTAFLVKMYPALSTEISSLLDSSFLIFIMWTAAMMVWQPGSFKDRLQKLLKLSFAAALVYICLGQRVDDSPVFQYFINPLEDGSLKLSAFILELFGAKSSYADFDQRNIYGSLASMVEAQVMMIVNFAFQLARIGGLDGLWSSIVGGLFALTTAVALLIPYTYSYVYIIFSLIDVMFTLMLIGSVSPILLAMGLFDLTRSYFTQGCKIISGAAFTMPFLSIAFGFTISIISPEINRASIMITCSNIANKDLDECKRLGAFDIFSYVTDPHFSLLIVLGWVSVLCLMQARGIVADLTQTSNSGVAASIASAGTLKSMNMMKNAAIQGGKGTVNAAISAGKTVKNLVDHFTK